MNKEDISGFIFDSIGVTIAFFINTVVVILFYHLTSNEVNEIGYPILMSITVYVIYMFFRGNSYFRFLKELEDCKTNIKFKFNTTNYEKKMVVSVLEFQFRRYMNEIAEINSKMKSFKKFFSQWIHDMKTPISVIEFMVQSNVLDSEINSIEGLKKEIKEENSRLLDNLDKALNFIRLEDFSKDYLPEEINLKESIVKIINKKKREFIYNRISPKVMCEEDEIKVITDRKWNGFIIEQLTNNAIKYSKSNNDSKNIYYIISKNDDKVYLAIKDEGIGIPDQDKKRIFEPFFTGENGRKVSSSSGVGLYLVKEVCERLNQNIEVNSQIEKGSEFKITYLLCNTQ